MWLEKQFAFCFGVTLSKLKKTQEPLPKSQLFTLGAIGIILRKQ